MKPENRSIGRKAIPFHAGHVKYAGALRAGRALYIAPLCARHAAGMRTDSTYVRCREHYAIKYRYLAEDASANVA